MAAVAAVALAWVAAQPGVAAPIASARNPEQLAEIELPGSRRRSIDSSVAHIGVRGVEVVGVVDPLRRATFPGHARGVRLVIAP